MTLQTITPPVYIGPKVFRDTTATTYTLDATGEYVAWVIQAPKTGTIDRIHFYATTVTADGAGLLQRIETVSTTDGNPTGTLVGGSSEITHATTTANSWNRGTTGLAAAVTKGDFIAVKLLSPAGTTFNGIIRAKFDVNRGPGLDGTAGYFPYIVNAIPTAAKVVPGGMCFALEYDDGTTPYIENAIPLSSIANTNYANSFTPDERGNLFQVPVPCRMVGVYHMTTNASADAPWDIVLYDSGGSVLESLSVDDDLLRVPDAVASAEVHLFDTAVSLSANTDYRLVIKPTSTGHVSQTQMVCDTSAGGTRLREAFMSGTTWKLTTRTDAGAWTNTDDTVACLGIIVDQLDDGAGGGSGGIPSTSQLGGVLQQ